MIRQHNPIHTYEGKLVTRTYLTRRDRRDLSALTVILIKALAITFMVAVNVAIYVPLWLAFFG